MQYAHICIKTKKDKHMWKAINATTDFPHASGGYPSGRLPLFFSIFFPHASGGYPIYQVTHQVTMDFSPREWGYHFLGKCFLKKIDTQEL